MKRLLLRLVPALALLGCAVEPNDPPESAEAAADDATPATPRPAEERWRAIEREIRTEFPGVRQLSTADLAAQVSGGGRPLLLDVREADEFAVSHLEGARLATDVDMALAQLEGVPRDEPVVVYCSVGYRSSRLAAELAERGFTDVANLEGSIFAWANEGRPVVRGDAPADEVHPYDASWGELLRADLRAERK